MLYILLSCVLTLSQMFPTIFKPREICNFNQGNGPFHLDASQRRHTPATKEYMCTRCMPWRCVCPLQWRLPKSNLHTYKIIHRCCGCSTETVINGLLFSFKSHFHDKFWSFLTISFSRMKDFSRRTSGS